MTEATPVLPLGLDSSTFLDFSTETKNCWTGPSIASIAPILGTLKDSVWVHEYHWASPQQP